MRLAAFAFNTYMEDNSARLLCIRLSLTFQTRKSKTDDMNRECKREEVKLVTSICTHTHPHTLHPYTLHPFTSHPQHKSTEYTPMHAQHTQRRHHNIQYTHTQHNTHIHKHTARAKDSLTNTESCSTSVPVPLQQQQQQQQQQQRQQTRHPSRCVVIALSVDIALL